MYAARLVLLVVVLGSLGACGGSSSPEVPSASAAIYTTFYPTTYFARRIAAGVAPIVCPLPAGADPIFWQPTREVIHSYQKARLILTNGAEFEKWVQTVSLPASRIVATAHPLAEHFLRFEEVTHSHGASGKHTHRGIDGHTWLDPINAKIQAGVICDALVSAFPPHEVELRANYAALVVDLDGLDKRLQALAPEARGACIVCTHPAYNYLGRRYNWSLINIAIDPGSAPSEEEVARLAAIPRDGRARILLWESPPLPASAERLRAECAFRSVVFSPCETSPGGGEDYLARMSRNLDELERALKSP